MSPLIGLRSRRFAGVLSASLALLCTGSAGLLAVRSASASVQAAALSFTGEKIAWPGYLFVSAINENGVAVGELQDEGVTRPFVYDPRAEIKMTILPTLGPEGTHGRAYGINSQGDVVGEAQRAVGEDETYHAFLWKAAEQQLVDLGESFSSEYFSAAFGISDDRTVVGQSDSHAVAWNEATGLRDLGPGIARAINSHGQIVGTTYGEEYNEFAALWEAGSSVPIALPGFGGTNGHYATDINDSGDVVGMASLPDVGTAHGENRAFLYRNGTITDLGNLPAENQYLRGTAAFAINNRGQVVGNSNYVPFLWENGQMVSLKNVLGRRGHDFIISATDINNAGQIATQAWDGIDYSSYILTPGGGDGGGSLADLHPTQFKLKVKKEGKARRTKYALSGVLKVSNLGKGKTKAAKVAFVLSSDATLSEDDLPLAIGKRVVQATVPALNGKKSDTVKLKIGKLSAELYQVVQGKYVFAIVDHSNQIAESEEHNNTLVSNQLPVLIGFK
ncbi:MAG: DUF3466 family protein [Armatimonadota bacterium]